MNPGRKQRSNSRFSNRSGRNHRRRRSDDGNAFIVRPVLPKGKNFNFFNGTPFTSSPIIAFDAEDAIRRAVVSGFIPSNTVMQYYEAVPAK